MPLLGTGILVNYLKENFYKEGMNKTEFKEEVLKSNDTFDEDFLEIAYDMIAAR